MKSTIFLLGSLEMFNCSFPSKNVNLKLGKVLCQKDLQGNLSLQVESSLKDMRMTMKW